ncbi:MAG: aminotransferase class V-fold PLP-dependent enzyme [Methanoregulaceae archaeon]|nr:aminotransferase class V-fold PLP-dependent enzyme [Methanoregulaceae archaeon]
MPEPPVKKLLYWCRACDVPLLGRSCACGNAGDAIPLLQPYDVRPALSADMDLLRHLVTSRFGPVPIPRIVLFNKTGGVDRTDQVIVHGRRFGWLSFDPVTREYRFDIAPDALPFIIGYAERGFVDLAGSISGTMQGRIGGKRFPVETAEPDGTVVVKLGGKYGTGVLKEGYLRVKELRKVNPESPQDPAWEDAVSCNRLHLKNLERHALRAIRQHMGDRPVANVSFSGGKDSTAVLHLARKAGINNAFFIDTGLEFPETVDVVRSEGVEIIGPGGDFWTAVGKAGPPGKDYRWCCKLLKMRPLRLYLSKVGPCVTIQGNRWYESWNRADLDLSLQNPHNPLQLNISPIRNWRALEVYLYLWWRNIPYNPLYDLGLERIGCYACPSVLESEYDLIRRIHPELAEKWDSFLSGWSAEKGLPQEYAGLGLWRWRQLPPKMQELCRLKGIGLDGNFSVVPVTGITVSTIRKETDPAGKARTVSSVAGASGSMEEPCQDISGTGPKLPGASVGGERRSVPSNSSSETGKEAGISSGQPDLHKGEKSRIDEIRKDFPLLSDLVYLDSAATSISPEPVLQAMLDYEHHYRANVGRGVHRLTQIASQRYWHAHEKVARFIMGEHGVTVFTKNTTEAINMVARGLRWNPGDRVVTTVLEHHSNLLPWLDLGQSGVEVVTVGITDDFLPDLAALEEAVDERTRLVAVSHASNVLGVVLPVKEIARISHDRGALLLVDGAQSVPHIPVETENLGCDFLAFSGHKMLGPTGTGVLWMKEPIIRPLLSGGGMVESIHAGSYQTVSGYEKYEAGTPNIGGGIGLGAAVDYLEQVGMDRIQAQEAGLVDRLVSGLGSIPGVNVFSGAKGIPRIGVVSFTVDGMDPHEVAAMLDEMADIMVRSGHHCCMPLMERLGLPRGTVRASLYLYNTRDEVDLLISTVEQIAKGL